MENGRKRRGRPRAQPQTGPLVLEARRARVKVEIELADTTADELREYARWVELSSSVATTEALFKTVDFALREVFRRDRLWREHRREGAESEGSLSLKMPSAPAVPPPALLPPNGSGSPRGTSERGV